MPTTALVDTLARFVLADLPAPEELSPIEAQQVLVHLSFSGASVSRHYLERELTRRGTPELAFEPLPVGLDRIPFLPYFTRVAARTGTGHGDRDSFATVVRWNAPTAVVSWAGERLAVLPGVFDDGEIRTYTGDPGERSFFELTKKSEALELAVNLLLEPLSAGSIELESAEAMRRVLLAATLLYALRQLNSDFTRLPLARSLQPDHFMDVFRQFAAPWRVGDIAPSGALDPESLKRDLLLGLDVPHHDAYLLRVLPGLLDPERAELTTLVGRLPVPEQLLAVLGLDNTALWEMSAAELRVTVRRNPALAAWYLLLNANARASGLHLSLAKKYLFRPAQLRTAAGFPDLGLVPRTHGTTGMDESRLERLVRARHNHVLSCLHQIPNLELVALAGIEPPDPVRSEQLADLVWFVPPAGGQHQHAGRQQQAGRAERAAEAPAARRAESPSGQSAARSRRRRGRAAVPDQRPAEPDQLPAADLVSAG